MSHPAGEILEAVLAGLAAVTLMAPAPVEAQTAVDGSRPDAWSAAVEIAAWILPDQPDFLLVQAFADRGGLHLEGRYNYEDLQTGSGWVGWTWTWGGTVSGSVTPMAGLVFGNTRGLAPGLELDLAVGPVGLYVETEYVFDLDDSSDDFYYAWSELGVAAAEWISAGLAVQRTRIVERSSDVAAGPFLGVRVGPFGLAGYLLDPFDAERFGVIQVDFDF
jgi:hypothetical protein